MNIGPHLNRALDNLLFSRLFKNPRWHSRATDEEIGDRLHLFARCTGGEPGELGDLLAYTAAVMPNRTRGLGKTNGIGKLLLSRLNGGHRHVRWGWKEPNTHIYLSHLAWSFPEIRYIHVLRNPLDMALSRNRQQLVNWGHLYGVDVREVKARTQMGQFTYSVAANTRALETGERVLGRRFRVVRFEAMCDSPRSEIARLLEFVGMPSEADLVDRVAKDVQRPASIGRYREANVSWLTEADLAQARQLGYDSTPDDG